MLFFLMPLATADGLRRWLLLIACRMLPLSVFRWLCHAMPAHLRAQRHVAMRYYRHHFC